MRELRSLGNWARGKSGDAMNKTVFINAFEFDYLGTRVLAAWLQQNGFPTHNICLKDFCSLPIQKPEEKAHGYQCWVTGHGFVEHCANFFPITPVELELLEQALRDEAPDLIGFSARSSNNFLIPLLVPVFKRAAPEALLVAGGFGPTLEPSLYLDGDFDVVVRGDGEMPLLNLAKNWSTPKEYLIFTAPGTVWNKKWGSHNNPLADQIKDISCFPPPLYSNRDFSYIDKDSLTRNRDPLMEEGRDIYNTYFGRGCIGKCTYCSGGHWIDIYRKDGKKAYKRRNRNIEDVITELESIDKKFKNIYFLDEFWSLSRSHTRDFFIEYQKRVAKPFFTYLNPSAMMENMDILDMVIDAGLYLTSIGFQTGSSRLSSSCYQRKQNYKVLIDFAWKLYKKFIPVLYHFIGGNCYETEEDFWETIKLLKRLPFSLEDYSLSATQVIRLLPHPESPIRVLAPKVVTSPMPVKEWYLRTVIMALAPITALDELKSFYEEYKHNPYILNEIYKAKLVMRRMKWFEQLGRHGKTFILYGGGDLYSRNKHLLENFTFEHALLDAAYMKGVSHIDTLPVTEAEDFFKTPPSPEYSYLVSMRKDPLFAARRLLKWGVKPEQIHLLPDLTNTV